MSKSATLMWQLAEVASARSFQHATLARQRAAAAFVDTIGCILAGAAEEVSRRVRKLVVSAPGQDNAIFVGGRQHPELAALANATAAHALDFDDHENLGITHPSAVLVPALLALGEQRHASGADVIDAYIAGYEVIGRVGVRVNPDHYVAGWHATSTIGALGAAAACSRLLHHDVDKMVNSLSLACSFAGGPRVQFGTMAKPLHAGLAAQGGVMSAVLADVGVTGSPDALDGRFGLVALMAGAGAAHEESADTGLAIETHGPITKRFPSCAATHRSLDSVLRLMDMHRLQAKDIRSVRTEIPSAAFSALIPGYPRNASEARFSMGYCLAVAIENGSVRLADFSSNAVDRPHLRRRAADIETRSYQPEGNPFSEGNYRVRTSVQTCNDEIYEDTATCSRGSPQDPLSSEEIVQKFIDCCSGTYCADRADRILRRVSGIDGEKDVCITVAAFSGG